MEKDTAGQETKADEKVGSGPKIFDMDAEQLAMIVQMFLANKDEARKFVDIFKPVIGEVTDLAMDTVGPEIVKIAIRAGLGKVEIRKAILDAYVAQGFSREEAVAFMMADIGNFQTAASGAMSAVNKK